MGGSGDGDPATAYQKQATRTLDDARERRNMAALGRSVAAGGDIFMAVAGQRMAVEEGVGGRAEGVGAEGVGGGGGRRGTKNGFGGTLHYAAVAASSASNVSSNVLSRKGRSAMRKTRPRATPVSRATPRLE